MTMVSYILSIIATVLGLLEPFGKNMRIILLFNFTGNFLVGVNYFLTQSLSGAGICAVACVQVIINYFFDSKNKKVPKWLIGVYALAFLMVNLGTFSVWYDIFALLAPMLFVLCVAQSDAKYYRIFYASNAIVWIFYDIFAKSYGNLLTHVILFLATSAAMMVRDRKQNTEK
ncbi:MAG: YgjV family protein [Clostridia bacterium]|nr:YgjV family protein [Clostridia bacterium]